MRVGNSLLGLVCGLILGKESLYYRPERTLQGYQEGPAPLQNYGGSETDEGRQPQLFRELDAQQHMAEPLLIKVVTLNVEYVVWCTYSREGAYPAL